MLVLWVRRQSVSMFALVHIAVFPNSKQATFMLVAMSFRLVRSAHKLMQIPLWTTVLISVDCLKAFPSIPEKPFHLSPYTLVIVKTQPLILPCSFPIVSRILLCLFYLICLPSFTPPQQWYSHLECGLHNPFLIIIPSIMGFLLILPRIVVWVFQHFWN